MSNQVITFGCRLNIFESEVIKNTLAKTPINDAIVINSCAVTKEAERQVLQAIRKQHKLNPDKKIIVTGCAAQLRPDQFAMMPEVDKVIGNEAKFKINSYLDDTKKVIIDDIMAVKESASHIVSQFEGKSRSYIQIQNGCNHRCTFCTIPYARGNSRSVAMGAIVSQVQQLVDNGYNEVVITGVDISDYGLDLPGKPRLGQMIRRLLRLVPDLKRLRISSIDIAEIDNELKEIIKFEPRIMPHLHISLQAGDDMILKRMKRRHNRQQVIDFCHDIRRVRPDIGIGADIIAGFPTETDEMFNNTKRLISEAGLVHLHVFPYSEREDTPARRMPQVDKNIRKQRAQILRIEGEKQLVKFLRNQLGTRQTVVVERGNIARAGNFSQVKLNQNLASGRVVQVDIIGIEQNKLLAQLVKT